MGNSESYNNIPSNPFDVIIDEYFGDKNKNYSIAILLKRLEELNNHQECSVDMNDLRKELKNKIMLNYSVNRHLLGKVLKIYYYDKLEPKKKWETKSIIITNVESFNKMRE